MDNNTHICATTADLERRLAASQAELAAARAQVASLQRQLTLKVEAFAFAVVVAPRRQPAVIRREPITKVMPCVEVQP